MQAKEQLASQVVNDFEGREKRSRKPVRWTGVVLGGTCLFATACSGGQSEAPPAASDEAAAVDESPRALAVLEVLRGRHVLHGTDASGAATDHLVLAPNSHVEFRRARGALVPHFGTNERHAVQVSLPELANDAFRVASSESGLSVSAKLRGARGVAAEVADGYVLYPAGGPGGETLMHRANASGNEDFVVFEDRPNEAHVTYEVELSSGIAGLRLVENTLEFLDATSTPRLRVAPPYLVDANGNEFVASLDVAHCKVDRDPAAPWDRPVVAPDASSCDVTVSFDASTPTYPAVLDPAWTNTANMTIARARHSANLLNNGRVLVAGGSNAAGTAALASAELFNPQNNTWAATASMAAARTEHTATPRLNGNVLVAGGWNLTTTLATAQEYDMASGTWINRPNMSTSRRRHTATLLQNGDILVTGGRSGNTVLATAQRFLASNNTWSNAASLLAPQEGHTATQMTTGRVLVVGPNAPAAELYNPGNNSWTATSGTPDARQFHTATLLTDGSVLVAGGVGEKSAERYRPNSDVWNRVGSLSFQHSGGPTGDRAATAVFSNGRVVLVGGLSSDRRAGAEIFNPTWGVWAPSAPQINTPRAAHASVRLNDGRVLVAGGIPGGSNTATASAETYNLAGGETTTTEYKLPAAIDPEVLDDRFTELWASVHRPSNMPAGQTFPLLLFLHGNHATCGTGQNPRFDFDCTYTQTGTCPAGFVVAPSHRGYDYIADELASRGYVVVSINANRGINCGFGVSGDFGLNLARGRLILRHMEELSRWNSGAASTPPSIGVSLQGRLNFDQFAMMGHSRGGEGARAAFEQYRDAGSPWPGRIGPVNFRGIFEIGPVDGQTSRILNADRSRWNVLLPACDGDVFDLEGVRPFDRMLQITEPAAFFKSTYTVWGANHNFYNTEWQLSDSFGCSNHRALFTTDTTVEIGSAEQRQTSFYGMLSFFTANVGVETDAGANRLFDTEFAIAPESRIDRGYHPGGGTAQWRRLEDFINPTGTSSYGLPNQASNVTVSHQFIPEHDFSMQGGRIEWTSASSSTFFQTNFAPAGSGFNLTGYRFLDLRLERASFGDPAETNFTVRLVNASGSLSSAVSIAEFVDLFDPPVGPFTTHTMLQTARMPLSRFTGANLGSVRAVRLTFSSSVNTAIYVAHIRATVSTTPTGPSVLFATAAPGGAGAGSALRASAAAVPGLRRISAGNVVQSLRSKGADAVEISLRSPELFMPKGELLVFTVGGVTTSLAGYPTGDLHDIVFTLRRNDFDALAGGEAMSVRYSGGLSPVEWNFGNLDKSRLDR
jgi:hypothetical protein